MSGLVKAKKYDWKDSNLALFGSDTEKEVKLESAQSEPAWQGAGQEVGLKVWRIVKFKVEDWPEEDYGKFFGGDSYIILNTYHPSEDSEELDYDVHFWIGENSSQDEYGTAAYKTVELDTFLNDAAVQHREVQGHESELFKTYFKALTIMKGGADTGFRHVAPEEYTPRLLHFCKQQNSRNVVMKEVPRAPSRLISDDVFILDLGLKLYQWNGSGSSKDERFKAVQYLQELKSERSGRAEVEVVDQETDSESHEFYSHLTEDDEEDEDIPDEGGRLELYKVSDESGSMESTKVKEGEVSIDDFDTNDVFMLETGKNLFVWVGNGASPAEKKNSMAYANNHLKSSSNPFQPIVILGEDRGPRNADFREAVGLAA